MAPTTTAPEHPSNQRPDKRPMPSGYSDDFDRALYHETKTSWQHPGAQRVTCPVHMRWSADCAHLDHTAQAVT